MTRYRQGLGVRIVDTVAAAFIYLLSRDDVL